MLKNNIYALLGIATINSNWNADFTGYSKTDGNGNLKGSPYALEYCIKRLWEAKGEKVLGLKEVDEKTGKLFTQEGKFNYKVGKKIEKPEDVINALSPFKDALNFGIVFAVKKINLSRQGVVQIGDALNKYDGTIPNPEPVLSPYLNSNKNDGDNSSLGVRITVNEAHYLYPLTITPGICDNAREGWTREYTEEDYQDFKDVSLKAVTLYNSKAKAGCKNEFGLFVRVKEEYNYQIALGDLSEYVKIYKDGEQVVYDLSLLNELLMECKEKIEDIELYYKAIKNKVVGIDTENLPIKIFNIVTGKEL